MLVSRARLVWTLLLLTAVAAIAVGYYYTQYLAQDTSLDSVVSMLIQSASRPRC
jgi:hypothetical protein